MRSPQSYLCMDGRYKCVLKGHVRGEEAVFVSLSEKQLLEILKTRQYAEVFKAMLHSDRPMSIAEVSRGMGIRYEVVGRKLARLLHSTLLIRKDGLYSVSPDLLGENQILLNFRDRRLDRVLRHRIMRSVALELHLNGSMVSSRELAKLFEVSDFGIRVSFASLSRIGLITEEGTIDESRIVSSQDPVKEVPQPEYREVVKYFRDIFAAQTGKLACSLILFGEAATGVMTLGVPLSFLAVVRHYEDFKEVGRSLAETADIVAHSYGAQFRLCLSSESVFWDYLWSFVTNPHPLMREALQGLVMWGTKPRRNLDLYYKEFMSSGPPTESRMKDWWRRGLLKQTSHGPTFTPTAIRVFRRKVPVATEIEQGRVLRRKIICILTRPCKGFVTAP